MRVNKKAIILDLDNTIYPVSSIGEELFKDLFKLIESKKEYSGNLEDIKTEIMRTPFQKVAEYFSFSESLFQECMILLENLTYNEPMFPFDDYAEVRKIQLPKFLVTIGFQKLQQSKVEQLKLKNDFEKIYIVDPQKSALTKKDIFLTIMSEFGYSANELLVVGDDVKSEIKAGIECGINSVLYDREGKNREQGNFSVISRFSDLKIFLNHL